MQTFQANVIDIYGELGKRWLLDLPIITKKIASKYSLSNLNPVDNLTYNYVMSGFRGHQPIILKLSFDIDRLTKEAYALNAFADFGAVKILAQQDGMLLLEQAIPGSTLKSYFPTKENEAIHIVCKAMKKLHQAPFTKHDFPHIKDWLVALDKDWEIPSHYLKKAQELRDKLLQNPTQQVLLHGDLHHDNILQKNNDWGVIDPKGVIGDSNYEIATFIRNPLPELLDLEYAANIINNRITEFAKILDLKPQLIREWCLVQSVLAWIWALEDNCSTEHFEKLTKIFYNL